AVRHGFPALVLTGCEKVNLDRSLFDGYRGTVFISYADTAETVRRLRLSVPVEKIMNATPDLIAADTHFSEAKETLISSSYRGLPVMENGEYYGIISRRCFIETPRNELILVDHNEIEQSIPGAAEAEITEIIDHHRMGSIRTRHPIFLDIRPLGSTSSIIYDICRKANVVLPPDHALLLLSGILSDTVILRSPTTTAFDRKCAEELAQICGCDPVSWGEEIFSRSSSLRSDDYGKTVMADFKQYNDFGYAVGISQIEVLTFQELPDVEYELYSQLHKSAHEMSLDWMLLLITNITKEESILLTTENKRLEETLVYPKLKDHQYSLKGILSRKKQLLPEVLRVLEQNRRPSDKSL
ncbi:MAG: DHHA2 domain-containing protein, partial [Spirochaetota bacterium]